MVSKRTLRVKQSMRKEWTPDRHSGDYILILQMADLVVGKADSYSIFIHFFPLALRVLLLHLFLLP